MAQSDQFRQETHPLTWVSAEIFPGVKVGILLILFRLLTMQCKWTFTKHFILSIPQRKCPKLRQQSQKCASLTTMLPFHSCFFSHRIKLRGLLLSAVIVSLHYLLSCQRFLRSTVSCGKTPTALNAYNF